MQEMNKSIHLLTDKEIEDILPKLDDFIRYAQDVKEHALKKAMNGHSWSNFKLVHSRGTRKIVNEEAVIKICKEAGIDPFESKLAGITELKKRIGKTK